LIDVLFVPLLIMMQGYFKVLGKGKLPSVPLIVKAKYFSKDVSFVIHYYLVSFPCTGCRVCNIPSEFDEWC